MPPTTTDLTAAPSDAAAHFRARLAFETDCADLAATLRTAPDSVVVVDSRSAEAYAAGHVPGAVSLPHAATTTDALEALDPDGDRLFVTYCLGPHCNGATRGAAAIAALGRPVKELLGGVWGWQQEGFALEAARQEVGL